MVLPSPSRLLPLSLSLLLVAGLIASSCSVALDDVGMTPTARAASASSSQGTTSDDRPLAGPAGAQGLPPVGPAPDSSHWHAAYVVRICDDVLPPFDDIGASLGIHTHGDGLIHVHPFVAEVGFEEATLQQFGDVVGFSLSEGELLLPGGGAWRNGDTCNGVESRVFVDRWTGPDPESEMVRHFGGFEDLRFTADGELYQIAFAPVDSPPVVPPTWQLLPDVSNLIRELPEPWVRVDSATEGSSVQVATVVEVTAEPCADGQLPEAVLAGTAGCYTLGPERFDRSEAIVAARAVEFNRQPAVDLTITPRLRDFIVNAFAPGRDAETNGLVLAVIIDGEVVTAPLLRRPSASEDRLILAGGLSVASAQVLAEVLNG